MGWVNGEDSEKGPGLAPVVAQFRHVRSGQARAKQAKNALGQARQGKARQGRDGAGLVGNYEARRTTRCYLPPSPDVNFNLR
jgi:hypothetical protein